MWGAILRPLTVLLADFELQGIRGCSDTSPAIDYEMDSGDCGTHCTVRGIKNVDKGSVEGDVSNISS